MLQLNIKLFLTLFLICIIMQTPLAPQQYVNCVTVQMYWTISQKFDS